MKTHRKLAALILGAVLVAAAPPLDMVLKEKEREDVGELLQEYYKAYKEKEGLADAKADLADEIAKIEGKLNKKSDKKIELLSLTDDVRSIFAMAKEVDKRPKTGKVVDVSADTFLGKPVEYAVHAPKAYKPSKGSVPLILIIPEEGVEPARCLDDQWLLSEIRNGAVIAAVKMPEDPSLWGTSSRDPAGGLETVMFALRDLTQTYAIDSDRVYLAGHGQGVAAAMDIAAIFPYVFAGVIGRSGDMGETTPTNFGNLPCYFTGGGSNVSTFESKAREAGLESVTINAEGRAEDVWKWIEETTRNASPETISFAPTTLMGTSAYWLTVTGYDLETEVKPEITVKVDKATNTIDVQATGILSVTLYFNDAIVDLDREVTVVCNGESYTDTFERSLSVALDQFYRSNDPSRVYTAGKVYDIPEADGN